MKSRKLLGAEGVIFLQPFVRFGNGPPEGIEFGGIDAERESLLALRHEQGPTGGTGQVTLRRPLRLRAPGAAALALLASASLAPAVAVAQASTGPSEAARQAAPAGRTLVLEVQQRLWSHGFEPGPVDGIAGARTRDAIRAFEREQGMPVTGEPTEAVWRALGRSVEEPAQPSPDSATQASESAAAESDPPAPNAVRPVPIAETPQETTLAGTTWAFQDDNGAEFSLTFEPDGRISGPAFSAGWTWTQERDDIGLTYENRIGGSSVRSGHLISGREMAGRGKSTRGGEWSWRARRIQ